MGVSRDVRLAAVKLLDAVSNERDAAACLSYLVEPPSPPVVSLVDEFGFCRSLEVLLGALIEPMQPLATSLPWDQVVAAAAQLEARVFSEPLRSLHRFESGGGYFIVRGSRDWPRGLVDLGPDQPLALWTSGGMPGGLPVALVGARACTRYGERVAQEMATELTNIGAVVVSGGAFGIDAAAHQGALAGAGKTVAVMAGGVDRLYPAGLFDLHAAILEHGCIISEMPPGSRPARWRFLSRNRLIAALSAVTVVVEAGSRSGALSTARRALEIGRPVGCIPGTVTSPMSVGTNNLIRSGADLVTDAKHVLSLAAQSVSDFSLANEVAPDLLPGVDSATEDTIPGELRRVYDALPKARAASLCSISAAVGLSERDVAGQLVELQLLGEVENVGQARWKRV